MTTKQKDRKRIRGLREEWTTLRSTNRGALKHRRVLVINRNYEPLTTVPLHKALKKVFKDIAVIVLPPQDDVTVWREMTWSDWADLEPREGEDVIQTVNRVFKIPLTIKIKDFGDVPYRTVKLSRRAIYRRDECVCQYCGKKDAPEELSIDHVIPKSKGGKTTFNNVVVACVQCNRKKDNKMLEDSGMKLLKIPKAPPYDVLQGRRIRVDSWAAFLGDCYWEVPLQD